MLPVETSREVADNSIRPGILKDRSFKDPVAAAGPSCRQLDPTGDTERRAGWGLPCAHKVADNSIRPGILKAVTTWRTPLMPWVADNSIRPGILKVHLAPQPDDGW